MEDFFPAWSWKPLSADGSAPDITKAGCGQIALPHYQNVDSFMFTLGVTLPWYAEQYAHLRDECNWRMPSVPQVAAYTNEELEMRDMVATDVTSYWKEKQNMSLLDIRPYDREYYETTIRPFLPKKIIDCHAHIWLDRFVTGEDHKLRSCLWPMLVAKDNSIEDLCETNRLLFPDNEVISVLYSHTNVAVDLSQSNPYVLRCAQEYGFPALYVAHPKMPAEEVEREVLAHPAWKGVKVYLEYAPAYIPNNEIRIYDFLTPEHLALADKHGWIVQLHIARPKRLADPVNYHQLLEIEQNYPNLQLWVAHLGRAYANEDVGDALEFLKNTEKTMWDFTANTNDWVMEQVLSRFGAERFIYGSDFPIFRMKARRVVENGFYINEIPKNSLGSFSVDYYKTNSEAGAGSVLSDPHLREIEGPEAEKITFFIYEEIAACRRACERLGLGKAEVEKIFYGNCAKLFGLPAQEE